MRLTIFQIEIALAATAFDSTPKRERNSYANDEKEKRKDEIGRRPTMPFRVGQGPVDVLHDPGLFTRTMPAMVMPRNTSSETRREQSGCISSD